MAQAAVHSLPWGETCSSESWRAVNHLAFGFASVTGSVGLLCQGGTYSGWKKGAAPWQFYTAPPSPLQQSIKGLWGSPGGAITVNFRGGGTPSLSTGRCFLQLYQNSPTQNASLVY